MLERLAHRGPDGQGARAVGPSWLGQRRLAIVDLERGAQPLGDERGDLWLVGDGEVYNHERLRGELGTERFRSRSDHEVALHLYEDLGAGAFERLWGTFAFAIAGEDGRFAASRDTLGVAPLYWARRGDTVLFASELKAFDREWRGDVEPFPTGHTWSPREGLAPWRPAPAGVPVLMRSLAPGEDPPAWVFDAVRDSLIRAVERALVAEVPVGVFLSGGVDSSIVTAIAARAAARQGWTLKTFAAGLPDSPDLLAARVVAEHVGTDHHERAFGAAEAAELVPEVIWMLESFDPTLVHSSVPNHLVAELARAHVKAVLVGEGADELFAGYSHYARHETAEDLHEELLETIAGLHIGGLQRVDRATSANGLEARIPFLDLDVVELALALPPAWKLTRAGRPAKALLRRAFDGWVPEEVLWREKAQFGQGTGMNAVLRQRFGATVSAADLERERHDVDPPLRTREELAYYRMFAERLPGVRAKGTIGRFVEA
ncbi:MAG: asparagine synthase (glutamine-hydrolyzing) [Solirubrobacterales bacterium]|nr:asparagine synthase (glutamine-hydrolyzing) [Solirubrobacterales bacterium]